MGCGGSKKVTKTVPCDARSRSWHDEDEDIRDKYDLGPILGSGSFGQVREATLKGEPNSEVRAVKMIERDNEDGEWSNQAIFVREVGLLQCIQHENIIRFHDFYEDLHFLYVVMVLCKGGEVFAKIVELKRFSEKNAVSLGQQMLKAIQYIHSMRIAHRDVKAENFMLSEPTIDSQVKMIDFGMACKFEDGQVLTELCGSPHYLAPELIGQRYTCRADVWAFGVLLYLLQYGHYPYDARHPRDIMVKILTEHIRWQGKVKLSKNSLDFLKRLLEHDPRKRMTPDEALCHPWMRLVNSVGPAYEGELLPTEVLQSAHKRASVSRKLVDPRMEDKRNQNLKKIDEDFTKGIRHGKRLGGEAQQREEQQELGPLSSRSAAPITSRSDMATDTTRRTSMAKMLQSIGGGARGGAGRGVSRGSSKLGGLGLGLGLGSLIREGQGGPEASSKEAAGTPTPTRPMRSMSVASRPRTTAAAALQKKRLSYIGALNGDEEKNLASLYKEKHLLGVLPPEPSSQPARISETQEEESTEIF